MADSKRGENVLDGKDVEIFLNTPLFRFRYRYGNEERELMENAVRLSGVILKEKEAGILLKVRVISNMKRKDEELPFDQIFIPYAKVDFMVVD